MSLRRKYLGLTVAALMAGFAFSAYAADFDAGVTAYSLGDFDTARDEFEALAETDPRAKFYLGRMFLRGQGVEADAGRGVALLEQAADGGVAAAMSALASFHKSRGERELWFIWISKAAEAGLPFAQAEVGRAYETGNGVGQNRRHAIIWYGRAARGGSAVGAIRLYRLGSEREPDKHGSVADVRARLGQAHAGDMEARFAIGALFADVGAHSEALDWYRLAADQGHHGAEYEVGLSYLTGRGVAKRESGGVVWIRRAVAGHHPAAMFQLGNIFRYGLGGIDRHEGLALEWYENAVQDGYSPATHAVVEMYLATAARAVADGDREAAREEIIGAITWYEEGVKLGDPDVSFAFALALHEGFGSLTVADVPSALVLYEIAAQQGSLAAAHDLARHFSGADVNAGRDADFETVYFWNAVLEADDPDDAQGFGRAAAAKRAGLAARLTEAQIADALNRVAAWRAQYR